MIQPRLYRIWSALRGSPSLRGVQPLLLSLVTLLPLLLLLLLLELCEDSADDGR